MFPLKPINLWANTGGLNQKPKSLEQEIPKKLKHLGFSIEGVRAGKVGKKSVMKFQHHPDAPCKYTNNFKTVLGSKPVSEHIQVQATKKTKVKKPKVEDTNVPKKSVVLKKGKLKVTEEALHNYIDTLGPRRPYKDNFSFEKAPEESYTDFMKRVETETKFVLLKSEIDNKFDVSDEKKMMMKIKTTKGMSEKKKQRLKEKKEKKLAGLKEKKLERIGGFAALQDKVEFGEVVHAPPVLSVRPKKAQLMDIDRPGLRMPELKAIFDGTKVADTMKAAPSSSTLILPKRKVGQTVKRKFLSVKQKAMADNKRESAIEAYRMLKKKKA